MTSQIIDFLFRTWNDLFNVCKQHWTLSIPILLPIFATIVQLIRGLYKHD